MKMSAFHLRGDDPKGTPITEEANSVTGVRYNIITDNQGSVVAMLDTSGNLAATYTYDPYGAITTTGTHAGENYLRWLGTYQLRGGVSLTGYRYYNPTWARFTQPDPTGQEANPYTYAQGDPINNSDPGGDSILGFVASIGKIIGYSITAGAAVAIGCGATAGAACALGVGAGIIAFSSGLAEIRNAQKELYGV
jgi:RHS repeat-associated protein